MSGQTVPCRQCGGPSDSRAKSGLCHTCRYPSAGAHSRAYELRVQTRRGMSLHLQPTTMLALSLAGYGRWRALGSCQVPVSPGALERLRQQAALRIRNLVREPEQRMELLAELERQLDSIELLA